MGLRHACRSTEILGKRLLFLLDNMAYWVLETAATALQISTTHVASSVSYLLQRSPSLSADGLCQKITRRMSHLVQSVTVQFCISMLINVGRLQWGQPLTRSCLPSSLPNPRELPVKKRKLESFRESAPALVLPTKVEEGWKTTRGKQNRVRTRAHAAAVRVWLVSTPSSTSFCPSSSMNRWTSCSCWHGWAKRWCTCWNTCTFQPVSGRFSRD